jgi:hypothetical protein
MYKSDKEKEIQRFLYERERKTAGLRLDLANAKLAKNKEQVDICQRILDKHFEDINYNLNKKS